MTSYLLYIAVTCTWGCGGLPPGVMRLSENLTVYYGDMPRIDDELRAAYFVASAFADRKCGKQFGRLRVEFAKDNFMCGAVKARGCYPLSPQPIVQVVYQTPLWESSLMHECLHHIYTMCTGSDGTDGFNNHSSEFLDDAVEANEILKMRLELDQ